MKAERMTDEKRIANRVKNHGLMVPKAKPGELIMRWGKVANEEPCVCFSWGEGVSKRDRLLLCSVLAKLEDQGYDLTTLMFSVSKKQDAI